GISVGGIPKKLILFPECYITFDDARHTSHESDPMVKDVCADCNNNKISYIDSYAKDFISRYFRQKYNEDYNGLIN
ncbi:MAG: hypothetical protein UHS54_00280, partial [Lachnospiraceae bacterium]|nr:hypothetical protein [Lachnospiraceae bacterium]